MPLQTELPADVLNAALAALEAQKQRIDEHIAQVRAMLGGYTGQKRRGRPRKFDAGVNVPAAPVAAPQTGKRAFSAATRARMAAAQRKRWAAVKNETDTPAKAPAKKRTMSAAARKRISQAMKKRWAAQRANQAA